MPTDFTKETCAIVLENIRQGAWPEHAAYAAGIIPKTLHEWLTRAEPKYIRFQEAYQAAASHARIGAEMKVLKDDPKFWLRYGPGRERYSSNGELQPGWGENAPKKEEKTQQVNILLSPVWVKIQEALGRALAEHPEARVKVASELALIAQEK